VVIALPPPIDTPVTFTGTRPATKAFDVAVEVSPWPFVAVRINAPEYGALAEMLAKVAVADVPVIDAGVVVPTDPLGDFVIV